MEGKKIENIAHGSMSELEQQDEQEIKETEKKGIILTEEQQFSL